MFSIAMENNTRLIYKSSTWMGSRLHSYVKLPKGNQTQVQELAIKLSGFLLQNPKCWLVNYVNSINSCHTVLKAIHDIHRSLEAQVPLVPPSSQGSPPRQPWPGQPAPRCTAAAAWGLQAEAWDGVVATWNLSPWWVEDFPGKMVIYGESMDNLWRIYG